MIDTLKLAERLEQEYGDDPEKARRHARILGDMIEAGNVATKQDLQELRADLRAEMYKALSIQAGVIIGTVVALIKLLP